MLLKILIFILILSISECCKIKCSKEICGGYEYGTLCNYLWSTSYRDCMSYLNKNNKDVINCFKQYNFTMSDSWSINNNYFNGIINCNNSTYIGRFNKTINYETYIKPILLSNCISKSNKLIRENINITCNYKLYQI